MLKFWLSEIVVHRGPCQFLEPPLICSELRKQKLNSPLCAFCPTPSAASSLVRCNPSLNKLLIIAKGCKSSLGVAIGGVCPRSVSNGTRAKAILLNELDLNHHVLVLFDLSYSSLDTPMKQQPLQLQAWCRLSPFGRRPCSRSTSYPLYKGIRAWL